MDMRDDTSRAGTDIQGLIKWELFIKREDKKCMKVLLLKHKRCPNCEMYIIKEVISKLINLNCCLSVRPLLRYWNISSFI